MPRQVVSPDVEQFTLAELLQSDVISQVVECVEVSHYGKGGSFAMLHDSFQVISIHAACVTRCKVQTSELVCFYLNLIKLGF